MFKKSLLFSILAAAVILLSSCGGKKPNYSVRLKSDSDSASYYIGFYYGVGISSSEFEDINIDALAKGWLDATKAFKELDDMELNEKMMDIQNFLNDFIMKVQMRAGEKNLVEGQEFLEANQRKQGVFTLPSGLQYKIIREGTGARAGRDDTVEVHYHGTLIDGTVFDSSKDRGLPAQFNVGQVVAGFSEALTLMSEGAVWEIYIPSELGYGAQARPPSIKPHSVLIFELELLKVMQEDEIVDFGF